MIIENLTTLKINQLTQAQYESALAAGSINENELYSTPDDNELATTTFLRVSDVGSAVDTNPINADTLGGKSASEFLTAVDKTELNNTISLLDLFQKFVFLFQKFFHRELLINFLRIGLQNFGFLHELGRQRLQLVTNPFFYLKMHVL